jgi:hypothetical protein
MSLYELEQFINENHHLPEMPTAEQVSQQGMNVGEVETLLVKKVEELTLYMIELKKENEELRTAIKSLKK